MGYREPEGIEAKMRRSEGGVEREDAEDEAPTVVVLNKGDLTEEEAKEGSSCLRLSTSDKFPFLQLVYRCLSPIACMTKCCKTTLETVSMAYIFHCAVTYHIYIFC